VTLKGYFRYFRYWRYVALRTCVVHAPYSAPAGIYGLQPTLTRRPSRCQVDVDLHELLPAKFDVVSAGCSSPIWWNYMVIYLLYNKRMMELYGSELG